MFSILSNRDWKENKKMPNWVINKLEVKGSNAVDAIKSHMTKNERGELDFDFNTLIKMPEELKVEESSKSFDGLKLFIAKYTPAIQCIGTANDKKKFGVIVAPLVKNDCSDLSKYMLKEQEAQNIISKYSNNIPELLEIGEKLYRNIVNYDCLDWYDWSVKNWDTKWNSCNTYILEEDDDKIVFQFDTAWSPSEKIIDKLAELHPDLEITYKYAEEQTGFMCGIKEYRNGYLAYENALDQFSKEAYELSFELWGGEDDYLFNEETGTYKWNEERD